MASPLEKARASATVNPALITEMVYGGAAAVQRRREITALFEEDPDFCKVGRPFLNHSNRYLASIAKCQAFHLKCEALGLTDPMELRWAYQAVDEILPTDVHMAMFMPALEYQTSEAQRDAWLPLAKSFRILGAYVQTELGHGSNVKALETTATFDREADSFLIHTPSVSATKWWPGGLGKTATHCVLHARLLLPTSSAAAADKDSIKDMGVHAFFVPLRDVTTHQPLPGITLGDIGPKLGFNSVDNGFASFHHHAVPRLNLLGGVAVVHPDGSYERVRGGEKRMYGSMLDVRANIVSGAATALAKACAITTRYSLSRKQGYALGEPQSDGEKEVSVLEHPTQRRLLLPWLSWCFALHFTGCRFRHHYTNFLQGDPRVPLFSLHAESSGLKALITQRVNDGIESLRKLCGGHGYSILSGLPELSANYLALATLEGTQQVLEPQTARFLLRAHQALLPSKSVESIGVGGGGGGGGGESDAKAVFAAAAPYLSSGGGGGATTPTASAASASGSAAACASVSSRLCRDPTDVQALLEALGLRAKFLAHAAAKEVETKAREIIMAKDALTPAAAEKLAFFQCGLSLGRLSRAHSEFVLMKDFVDATTTTITATAAAATAGSSGGNNQTSLPHGSSERALLSHLCSLFGLHLLTSGDCQAELMRLKVFTPEAAANCEAAMDGSGDVGGESSGKGGMLETVQVNALALVEAWDFTDASLGHSALGAADGEYAKRLLSYAKKHEPLNDSGFDQHLQHIRKLTGPHRAKL